LGKTQSGHLEKAQCIDDNDNGIVNCGGQAKVRVIPMLVAMYNATGMAVAMLVPMELVMVIIMLME